MALGPIGAFLASPILIVALIFKEHLIPAQAPRLPTNKDFRRNYARNGAFSWHPTPRKELSMSSGEGEAAMKDLSDKVNYDRLLKDVDAVKNDISNLAGQITDALNELAGSAQKQARHGYKQARSNVDTVVSDITKHGNAALESAQDAAATLGDSLEDAVQQRPLAAVGLALGLGFLIGVTWRR